MPPANQIKYLRKKPIFNLLYFIHDSRSVGIVLLACTFLSLLISNFGGFGEAYHHFWETEIPILHKLHLPHTLHHFINDTLMALFFFMVGMEIKRETIIGELSSFRRMILPAVAAIGGVVVPAFIFLIFSKGTVFEKGWAIPTATDIAFSLGILAMVGNKVPFALKVFLTALAIIDDLCAIFIIAFFYGTQPDFVWLIGVALSAAAGYLLVRKFRDTKICRYILIFIGILIWFFMYNSGIHATFAGVIMAMLMPIERIPNTEKVLHIPVNFMIIPIFALANTSIIISGTALDNLLSPLSFGVFFGLLFGKPIGITLATLFLVRQRVVRLPSQTTWMEFIGVGFLAGIGFTMSIFVSTLAYVNKDYQDTAKLSVLIASFLAMIIGFIWMKLATRTNPESKARPKKAH